MARTAALTSPYEGTDSRPASCSTTPRCSSARSSTGHLAGWQLAVHAIGDRAVDVALDALEKAQRLQPPPGGPAPRSSTPGLVRPDQLPRFAALGVTAVVQPNFLRYFGDDYAAIMGEERAPLALPGPGLPRPRRPAGGQLGPAGDGRRAAAGDPVHGRSGPRSPGRLIGPDEAITVDEALRAYTVDGRLRLPLGGQRGQPHRRASAPTSSCSATIRAGWTCSRIGDIEVVRTFVEGEDEY